MLCTMPSRQGGAFDAKVVTRIYVDDLSDLPSDAVKDAIRGFRRGELGDLRFAPTVGEIRAAVLKALGRSPEQLAEKAEFDRRMAERERVDRETLAERGRRAEQWEAMSDEERERAAMLTEIAKQEFSRLAGKKVWGEDADATPSMGPVTKFSEKLVAQFRGELPIGEGKLGPLPLAELRAAE